MKFWKGWPTIKYIKGPFNVNKWPQNGSLPYYMKRSFSSLIYIGESITLIKSTKRGKKDLVGMLLLNDFYENCAEVEGSWHRLKGLKGGDQGQKGKGESLPQILKRHMVC